MLKKTINFSEKGGAAFEYMLVSIFATFATFAILAFISGLIRDKLRDIGEEYGLDTQIINFNPFDPN
ncbi:MAG: hypothetical protein CMP11_01940 [Zetaproteobacteria bacterium]|nr:hypothetical protein [Pseudobdellovibrionaceae bacterium]